MSLFSRRLFLGVAAAFPAASAAAANDPVTLDAPASPSAENPEIFSLGGQLDAALDELKKARLAKRDALLAAERFCPPLPEELIVSREDRFRFAGCADREVDFEGKGAWAPLLIGEDGTTYAQAPRQILKAALLKERIADGNFPAGPRSKLGRQIRKLVQIAERFEFGRADAIRRSGISEAIGRLNWVSWDIRDLSFKLRDMTPLTSAGVLVQARALLAYSECEVDHDGWKGHAASALGATLATSVLRIAGVPTDEIWRPALNDPCAIASDERHVIVRG